MSDTTAHIVRRHGFWETLNTHASRQWLGMGTMVAMAQGTGPVTERVLNEVVGLLWKRHQILRCRLTDDVLVASFVEDVRVEDIPVHVRHVSGESGVVEVFEQLLHEELPDQRRLWGVLFSPEPDESLWRIFIKTHHCIADGRSIGNLLDQCVEGCACLLRGKRPDWPPLAMGLPAEQRVADPMTMADTKRLADSAPEPPAVTRWPLDHKESDPAHRRCRVAFRSCDTDVTVRLRDAAHDRGLGMMGVLAAAGALTQARRFGTTVDTDHLTPVDMRRFFADPPDPADVFMGAYVIRVMMPDVDPQADPWDVARAYHEAQAAVLVRDNLPPCDFTDQDMAGGMEEWADADGAYRHGFCFSNVGSMPWTGDHPPLTTDRVEMTAEAHMGGVPMLLPVVTHKGVMRICFTWVEPLMDDAEALRWMDGICGVLDEMAAG